MRKYTISKIVLAFSLLFSFSSIKAQLSVTQGQTPTQYVNSLIGSGVQVLNVTYSGTANTQLGNFNGTGSNIGLPSGVIMSSGDAADAAGSESGIDASTNVDGVSGPSDPDLALISGNTIHDASVLEFDIVPLCDTISIFYVFASEEYPDYVCANVNDAFGFFVSGPGIAGPFSNGAVNIATVPGTNTQVSINTVNPGVAGAFGSAATCNAIDPNWATYNTYYTSNAGGLNDVEYGGFTVPMEAKIAVTPCDTYHVKLAIGDGGDNIFDSAVFLEQGGIVCTGNFVDLSSVANTTAQTDQTVEGCAEAIYRFTRSGDLSSSQTIYYATAGDATMGVDYPNLPGSVTFAPGQDTVEIIIPIFTDTLTEGIELLQVILLDTLCGNPYADTSTIRIYDPTLKVGDITASKNPACPGDTITLNVNPSGGIPPFVANWIGDPDILDTNSTNPQVVVSGTKTYYFQITDSIGCIAIDSIDVVLANLPVASFSMSADTGCLLNNSFTFTNTGSFNFSSTYLWDFGPNATPSTATGTLVPGVTFNATGWQYITLVINDTCSSVPYVDSVFIQPNPTASFLPSAVEACIDNNSFNFTYNGTMFPGMTFNWNFGPNATPDTSSLQNPTNIHFNTLGNQSISLIVTDSVGCTSTAYFETVLIKPKATGTIVGFDSVCLGESITLQGAGADMYIWGVSADTSNSINFTPNADTTVFLIPVLSGCLGDTVFHTVQVNPVPTSTFTVGNPTSCSYDSVLINYTGTGTVNDTYIWDFDGGTILQGTPGSNGPFFVQWATGGPKTISLVIQSEFNCPSDTTYHTVTNYVKPIVNVSSQPTIVCANDSVQLSANAQFGDTSSYTYVWSPNYNISGINSATPTVWPTVDTTYYVYVVSGGCVSDSQAVFVQVNNSLQILASNDTAFCFGSGGGQIFANTVGGSGSITYVWFPDTAISNSNDQNPIVNPGTSTWYYVEAIDSSGCHSNMDSVFVQINPLPIADAGADQFKCSNEPGVTISGSVANDTNNIYSYQWTPTTGLACPTCQSTYANPDTTTIYTLVITNQITGCTSDSTTLDTLSTVIVTVNQRPTADAGNDKYICNSGSVQIDGTAFGTDSASAYTYIWTPSTNLSNPNIANPIASPTSTTEYSLTVIDSKGCISQADTVKVFVIPTPTVDAGPTVEICEDSSITLTPTISGTQSGVPISYAWTPGIGLSDSTILNPITSPNMTTVYTLTVTHGSCVTSDSIIVNVIPKPDIDITNPPAVCSDDSIQIVATVSAPDSFTFTWTPSAGLNNPNSLTPFASPDTSTWYTLEVYSKGCSSSVSVLITVKPEVHVDIVPNADTICSNGSTQLHVIGADSTSASYSWTPSYGLDNPNIHNPIALPDTSLWYYLTVNQGGCTDMDSIYIHVNKTPIADFVTGSTSGCDNYDVNFINLSSDGKFYLWDFGDGSISNETNPIHTYTSPGKYLVSLTVLADGACGSSIVKDSLIEVYAGPKANFSTNYTSEIIIPEAKVQFTDQSTGDIIEWLWNFGDNTSSTEQNPLHEYMEAGTYEVSLMVTDKNACVDVYKMPLPVVVMSPEIVVPNIFTPNGDGFNDDFRVNYTGVENYNIVIFDRNGQEVFASSNKSDFWDGMNKNSGKAPEGVYFYVLKIGDKKYNGSVTLLR